MLGDGIVSLAVTPGSTMDFRNVKSAPKTVSAKRTGASTASAADSKSTSPSALWKCTWIFLSVGRIPPSR
jgi:hypothetical protein